MTVMHKQNERDAGGFLWEHDEPATGLHKARTGDIHGYGADAVSLRYCAETKYTTKPSRAIKRSEWNKLKERARQLGKVPLFKVHAANGFVLWAMAEEDLGYCLECVKKYEHQSRMSNV